MFELKNATPPAQQGTGLTDAIRKMPVSDHMALDVPYGGNARARRASVYQIARRLGYVLRVHDTGNGFQVWRVK